MIGRDARMVSLRMCLCIGGMIVGTLLPGCNYLPGNASDSDAEFADLELDDEVDQEVEAPKRSLSRKEVQKEEPAPPLELPAKGELGLHLAVGDRFPLRKTVEQRLTQPGDAGFVTGQSRLDMLMSLAVEELRDGQTRLAVRYHSVRYREQDIEGRTIEYDSAHPEREVPPQALAYAGLVDNGFSFWIGADNRLVDLVGFSDFVQRCVRDVPPSLRQAVVAQLSAANGENGIANFIDDSIGLLPVGADPSSSGAVVQLGTTWDLPVRKIDGPIPMQVSTQCKIKGLTDRTAEIDLFGSIGPARHADPQNGWTVTIVGGRCLGSCTVDRRTGIPTNSLVQRYVDLRLELPDGSEVKQRKEITTTITAFLNQDQEPSAAPAPRITPASHEAQANRGKDAPLRSASTPRNRASDDLRVFR
jgi:hypothetical protein